MRILSFLFIILFTSNVLAGEKRQLDSHEHGHGTLNIAVEDNKITMELEVPGADIVGFEHEAKTKKDKATLKKAISDLKKPLGLFVLPSSAVCKVKEAKVKLDGEEHDHHHKHHHKDHGHKKHKKGHGHDKHDKHKHEEESHNEFHTEYVLNCKKPSEIKTIDFKYFDRFKGAEELDVNIISAKGQKSFEAKRKSKTLDVSGSF